MRACKHAYSPNNDNIQDTHTHTQSENITFGNMHVIMISSIFFSAFYFNNLHIYLETLKTPHFSSTVSFTGLTGCCFLFNIIYCHVIRNN